jgi:hypothetical protein
MDSLTKWLSERLDVLDAKLDIQTERLGSVDTTLAKQAKDLEYHIYRTDLLQALIQDMENEVAPITTHVQRIRAMGWVLTGVVALLGVVSTAVGIWKAFH